MPPSNTESGVPSGSPRLPGVKISARDLSLIAVFAGVMAALGLVPAWAPPGFTVPLTAQSMGVMLAGGILGGRRGALSMLVFLALVAIGLPVLAGGRGGLGVFAGPSVGFLVGFPVAAYVVGVLSERLHGVSSAAGRLSASLLANLVGGVAVLYVFGVLGMALNLRIPIDEATTLLWIYVPGDLLKVVLAALVVQAVHAGYPGLLQRPAPRERATAV
jgi:biotin transport system substrate-specific component